MTEAAKTVLTSYEVRKTKRQKEAFRAFLCRELGKLGYEPRVESGRSLVTSHNVVAGDPEKARGPSHRPLRHLCRPPLPQLYHPPEPPVFLLYQLAVAAVIFILAIAVEVALIMAFDPPLWAALLAMYAALAFCIWWMLAGKANRRTANDNTSGVIALLEMAAALPPEDRDAGASYGSTTRRRASSAPPPLPPPTAGCGPTPSPSTSTAWGTGITSSSSPAAW